MATPLALPHPPSHSSSHSPHPASAAPRSFQARFGSLVHSGITAIPNALYDHQATLGLSFHQVGLIGAILRYRWDGRLPYPSLAKIAHRCGLSQRSLQRSCRALQQKGLLTIRSRGGASGQAQQTNTYDFSPLFARLVALQRQRPVPSADAPAPDRSLPDKATVVTAPPPDLSVGGVTDLSPPIHKENPERKDPTHQQSPQTKPAKPATSSPPPNQVCVQSANLLKEHGVSPPVATRLAGQHRPEQIAAKVQLLAWLHRARPGCIHNPGAWLHKAIQEDYQAPAGFTTREERDAAEQAQRAEQKRERGEEEHRRQEMAQRTPAQWAHTRALVWAGRYQVQQGQEPTAAEIAAQEQVFLDEQHRQEHGDPAPGPKAPSEIPSGGQPMAQLSQRAPVSVSPPSPPRQEPTQARAAVEPERAAMQQEYRAKLQHWIEQQEHLRGKQPSPHEVKAQWAMFMAELIEREQGSRPSSTQDQHPAPSAQSGGTVLGQVLEGMAARLASRSAAPSPAGASP
ncbi:MAG: helix-turn-helix domain-containing protein [Planctomycetota bacterium]|nr:helix-turn-helix domain-containing protein [Planctomycetota bacterium]